MLYYNADPRDGGMGGSLSACQPCCCQPLHLRPGETNLVVIDYSYWALPIGWIVPRLDYSIEKDESTCDNVVDNGNYSVATPANTPVGIDLTTLAVPDTGEFMFEAPLPLSGPQHGTLEAEADQPGKFMYTPTGGWTGYDYFDYRMTDADGNSVIGTVEIHIGTGGRRDAGRMSDGPYINLNSVVVDERNQLVRFPIYMPADCRACDSYRLIIKQPARDCDGNVYNHFSCFNVSCKDC